VLKALLWDVDGTLAETERDGHRVAFNRAFDEDGLDWHWDVDRYGELLAVTGGRERMLHDLRQRYPDLDVDVAWQDRIARLHRRKNAIYARIVRSGDIRLRPGVARLVAQAHAAGLSQAIVTTTSRDNCDALLEAFAGQLPERAFSLRVCGEDVTAKKPDPQAYRLALAGLGIDAAQAIAIEDSPAGLRAATAAGIGCVLTCGFYTRRDRVRAMHPPARVVTGDLDVPSAALPRGLDLQALRAL
jgi:HAD superfamily hydrolase (TIGR01509 family)